MKRVKLINDPAELEALFRAVVSDIRRNVLSTLAEDWTMISDLTDSLVMKLMILLYIMKNLN